jgi:hypothetical protein
LAVDYGGSGNFEVISYDTDDEPLSTLVYVSGVYSGKQALNFGGVTFSAIEILTSGTWKVQVLPLSKATTISVPGSASGTNSNVFVLGDLLFGVTLETPNATGWVGVIGYGDNGYVQILIDAPAPYSDSVSITDPEIKYLEISVVGPWSLTVK